MRHILAGAAMLVGALIAIQTIATLLENSARERQASHASYHMEETDAAAAAPTPGRMAGRFH